MQLVNSRLRLTLVDGRVLLGQLLAYDKHMNLVLADTEEYRRPKKATPAQATEMRRSLGLILLRGQHIVSMTPEGGPPPADANRTRTPASVLMAAQGNAMRPGMPVMQPVPGMVPPPMGMPMQPGFVPPPGMPMMPPPGMAMPPRPPQ